MNTHITPISESEAVNAVRRLDMTSRNTPERIMLAIDIVLSDMIKPDGNQIRYRCQEYIVVGWTSGYRVFGNYCTCPDHLTCKHILARVIYEDVLSRRPIPVFIPAHEPAREAALLAELGY